MVLFSPAGSRGFDVSTPVVVFRAESYCALGLFRSLGRLGVRVYGVDHSPEALGLLSRYCAGRFAWDVDRSPAEATLAFLKDVARRIGGRPLLLPTFDTRSLLVANHSEELAEYFRFPRPEPGAVSRLYDKRSMYELCKRLAIPTSETLFPTTIAEAVAAADRLGFPVVVKAIDRDRLMRRTGRCLAIVARRQDLVGVFEALDEPGHPNLMLQEFIPGGDDVAWILNGYFNERSECLFSMTGRRLRQNPVHTGLTSLGVCQPCQEIEQSTRRLVQEVGYRGIIDVDYRQDRRDGSFKLLDVNPRLGATFRLFVDRQGLDVARSWYLDLTGQGVPQVQPQWGRRWFVEDKDIASCLAYRREGSLGLLDWLKSYGGVREAAHVGLDDLRPTRLFLGGLARRAGRKVRSLLPGDAGAVRGKPEEGNTPEQYDDGKPSPRRNTSANQGG